MYISCSTPHIYHVIFRKYRAQIKHIYLYIYYHSANDLGAAFCPEKTFGIDRVKCWMHKLNRFIDMFNGKASKEYDLIDIWLRFVGASSSKVPQTNFKFAMDPTVLASNTNRMALTYISQCAVYHNLPSVKQWWSMNDASNAAFLDFIRSEKKVLFIANLSILLSEVCMYIYIYYIIFLFLSQGTFL